MNFESSSGDLVCLHGYDKDCGCKQATAALGRASYEVVGEGTCVGAQDQKSRELVTTNALDCQARCTSDADCTGYDIDGTACSLRIFSIASITVKVNAFCYRKLPTAAREATTVTVKKTSSSGQYFHFDQADWAAMVGSEATKSGQTYKVVQTKNGIAKWSGEVIAWSSANDEGPGGRRNPMSARKSGQWATGDVLALQASDYHFSATTVSATTSVVSANLIDTDE